MKKLISIFAVSLVLVFSCVPAFAESQVIEGYAVDDVPYNEAFEGVLTASDNGSQLYSSTKDKTYNTSSVLRAPATSSSAVYTAKSITDFLPLTCFVSSNTNYNRSVVTSNGYSGINFGWSDASNKGYEFHTASRFAKSLYGILKPSRKYRITFTIDIQEAYYGQFDFNLVDSSNNDSVVVRLFSRKGIMGSNVWLSGKQNVSIDVVMPDDIGTPVGFISANIINSKSVIFYINDFTITDITTEDLDNSINQGVEKIENAGSDSPPLDTDISAFQSAIDTMNGWLDQLNEFADTIDSAGVTAKDYISKGTELFNGFMGVAPASVIALIAFGIVFLVIRKIVGR
nr:MAG TPA: hypothetical protein [Inoviridae sp.]